MSIKEIQKLYTSGNHILHRIFNDKKYNIIFCFQTRNVIQKWKATIKRGTLTCINMNTLLRLFVLI